MPIGYKPRIWKTLRQIGEEEEEIKPFQPPEEPPTDPQLPKRQFRRKEGDIAPTLPQAPSAPLEQPTRELQWYIPPFEREREERQPAWMKWLREATPTEGIQLWAGTRPIKEPIDLAKAAAAYGEAAIWMFAPIMPSAMAGWKAAGTLPTVQKVAARTVLAPLVAVEKTVGFTVRQTVGRIVPTFIDKAYQINTLKQLRVAGIELPKPTGKALMSAYRKSLESHLEVELRAFVSRTGKEIPANTSIRAIELLSRRASPEWASSKMVEALSRGKITPKMIQTVADTVAREAVKPVPVLLDELASVKPPTDIRPTLPEVALLPPGLTKAPEVVTPIPKGVTYLAPPAPMADYGQKVRYHLLLQEKAMGKAAKRKFARLWTGKSSMADMTEEQAKVVIGALERMPRPTRRIIEGKSVLIPPSIPKTKAVVPENFFDLQFKQPTPVRYFTSQTYYAQQLGVKPLVEPLELAKQRFDLEAPALSAEVSLKIGQIEKIAKTSFGAKARAFLSNKPTEAVRDMNKLLNEYEEPPDFLSLEERKIFTWFRHLSRTIIRGENEVRALLGMEPIPYRQAYVRKVAAEGIAWEIMNGIYPIPENLKYWATKLRSKEVFNPMAFHRQLSSDLEAYFSEDLGYATKAMIWTGLKEIHLSQPLRAYSEQLSAITKDLPVYDKLSAEELQRVHPVMPAETRKWLDAYVNQVIKGQPTDLDTQVNALFANEGIRGVINKFLTPFGRTLGRQPVTTMGRFMGRAVMAGVMGPFRPKLIIRNKFQLFQNLALYKIESNIKGIFPAPQWMKDIMGQSLYLRGYTGLEGIPTEGVGKVEKLWHKAYRWSAVSNAHQSMKVAGWDAYDLISNPKYKELGWADPQRTYKEPRGFLYPSEKAKMAKEMDFGPGATQYGYIPMEMPELFRHKTLIPLTRLQSWWMNYFFRFHREAFHRAFKGETSYGAKLPWSRRLAYLKYLTIGGAILTSLGYRRSFLIGVLPVYMSPVAQFMLGIYSYATADSEWARNKAKSTIFYSWRAFIPGSLAWKDFSDVWSGKKPLESLFFYMKPEEDKQISPTPIPEGGLPKRQFKR